MKILRAPICVFVTALSLIAPAIAEELHAYADRSGERVTFFESADQNYRLELGNGDYTYVDFTGPSPDASFAAIRFQPNAFTLVIAEPLDVSVSAEQYADMVQVGMSENLDGADGTTFLTSTDLGYVEMGDNQFFQKQIQADVSGAPGTYILSATVDGSRAYQILTFGTNIDEQEVRAEADSVLASFSIVDSAANQSIVIEAKSVRDYRSTVFGYRFKARDSGWYAWNDLSETNDGADVGALSSKGLGSVVMPVCWPDKKPTDNAVYRIMMQQFGEDYPAEFITEEYAIEKGGASGKLLVGIEATDDGEYLYKSWVVINDRCAYTLAAWGPAGNKGVLKQLDKLWKDFRILDAATASAGEYESDEQKTVNAYLLNALGLHYYDARSYRDANGYFSAASDLDPTDQAYVTNALRSLSEIDAYAEAYDWLQSRLGPFADDQAVQSWDAWLAYQNNDAEKALRIYRGLFAADYREDDDFSVYLSLLADADQWDELDSAYAAYTAGGVNDATRLLQVQLLSRRERYDDALALLDVMTNGRPFDADLVYERMSILDDMGNPAAVLELADSLIANGYRSLQSYYYKGDAEYQLRSYRIARESFEQALTFSPGNTNIREYLDAIDLMLGQGDISTISTPIDAVALPKEMQKIFAANDTATSEGGYGAEFLSRITGYDFSGGDKRTETMYRKIRVVDDNGISQFSTLEFDYDPSYESLFVNSLVVKNAAGEVLGEGDLDTYYITHNEDGYEASTEKTVHLPVPSLAPGVIIEAVVSKLTGVEESSFPLETHYLATERPIGYSAVFVAGKHDQIRYQTNSVPEPRKRGNAMVWELQAPMPFRWEPLQPYFDQILPWVQLGTVGEDWQSVGAEYLVKIEDKLDTKSVTERATRLIDGISDDVRKIEILSAYVQDEIHYEAIEFGRRAYMPKTARETMRDRYGDCKDHAVLLYTMMNAVGIDASLALVNLQQEVVTSLPNTDQFNHMIVAVPAEGGLVFVDTTDKDMRLGQLPPRSMAGNHALVLGENSELMKIPDYESELTGLSVERVVEPRDDGTLNVIETARFSGYQAAEFRGQIRTIETSELQASLQRWVADRYSDAELTDHFVENVFDAGYDLVIEIQYTLPLDKNGTFEVPSFLEAYYLEYERVAERRFPFEFFYPLRVSATTSVKFPSDRSLDELTKKPFEGESKFGNWRREVSKGDGNWEIRFDYLASDARFDAEDYRDFSEFQRKAIDAIEQDLVLQ